MKRPIGDEWSDPLDAAAPTIGAINSFHPVPADDRPRRKAFPIGFDLTVKAKPKKVKPSREKRA